RLALELGTFNEYRTRDLRTRLGEALANAGLGVDAAEYFLAASEGAKAADALELRRRAAELLVRTGHFERGIAAVRSVLAAVGAELPATPKKALLALVRRRLWLRLRGFGFKRRDETQIPKHELTRVDVCWTMAAVLSTTDTIRGAELQTRAML